MENTGWYIQAKGEKRRCRSIDSGNTTGIRMGQDRYNNMDEDRKRHVRLEWKC